MTVLRSLLSHTIVPARVWFTPAGGRGASLLSTRAQGRRGCGASFASRQTESKFWWNFGSWGLPLAAAPRTEGDALVAEGGVDGDDDGALAEDGEGCDLREGVKR